MTNFYMLVGLPGSGKSNIAKKMKNWYNNFELEVLYNMKKSTQIWADFLLFYDTFSIKSINFLVSSD